MQSDAEERARELEELFGRHHRMVTVYLRVLTGDWDQAAELTQDTFLTAYRKMGSLQPGRPAGPWLRGIARNLARNAMRRKWRHREFLAAEGSEAERVLETVEASAPEGDWTESLAVLDRCLEQLPERQRSAVDRFYRQGRSAAEIAAELGVRERSVFQLLWQARSNLRTCMERSGRRDES